MDFAALAIVLALFGLLLILLSYRRQVQHRLWSAIAHGVAGVILFLLGALLFTVALNLNTYERSQVDQPLAQLSVDQTGNRSYRVSLTRIPSGDLQVFNLSGDRWRIAAQQLNWGGRLQWLGLRSDVRLESLQSSAANPTTPDVVSRYSLSRNPGIDLWKMRQQHARVMADELTLRSLDSGNVALVNGLRYHIYLTADGLVARAINKRNPATESPIHDGHANPSAAHQ